MAATGSGSSTAGDGGNNSELLALPKAAAAEAASSGVVCEGIEFTVTERNEVAARECVGDDGAALRVLESEGFFLDAATGTRGHFVDVQGQAEAMLFLVSVQEDDDQRRRRIVAVMRC